MKITLNWVFSFACVFFHKNKHHTIIWSPNVTFYFDVYKNLTLMIETHYHNGQLVVGRRWFNHITMELLLTVTSAQRPPPNLWSVRKVSAKFKVKLS